MSRGVRYSEKEAAARTGWSRHTLLRARKAGELRFYRRGRNVRYSEEQLAAWEQKQERPYQIKVRR